MSIIRTAFDLPPSGNRYWRHSKNGKPYLSEEAKAYRELVGWTARALEIEPIVGSIKVTIDIYRKAKRGDLDNFAKIALDSMQGHLFLDDAQVVELHMRRFDDKAHPRMEVKVESVK